MVSRREIADDRKSKKAGLKHGLHIRN